MTSPRIVGAVALAMFLPVAVETDFTFGNEMMSFVTGGEARALAERRRATQRAGHLVSHSRDVFRLTQ